MMNASEIQNLSRKELQALAKERGIKANSKSKVLIDKLSNWFEENKENEEKPVKTKKTKTRGDKKNEDYNDLDSMSRKDLQNLCKTNGIRANQKTSDLLKHLKKVLLVSDVKKDADKSTVKKDITKKSIIPDSSDKMNSNEREKDNNILQAHNKCLDRSTKKKNNNKKSLSLDMMSPVQYGNRRRKSLKAKQLVSFNETFDDAMKENNKDEKTKTKKKKTRKIYVKALKSKPFKVKKSKRSITAPQAFNLSTSNFGSHKKRNRSGEPLKPTWQMKTKPLPPFRGESMFSPKKPRKRTKNVFNLKQSLSMPLTWVPKKGKLPSFKL